MKDLSQIRDKILILKGQRQSIEKSVTETEARLKELEQLKLEIEEAQKVVQDVALLTQNKLKLTLEPIVTLALEIVFEDEAYGFQVDFDVKRNKTECQLSFTRNGETYNPMASTGFGVVDVAAFALRLALWNISKPTTRATFILDEPFKHASIDIQNKIFNMVKTLSEKLDLQIILIAHNFVEDVLEYSDKVFRVSLDKNFVSKVQIIKGE